MVTSATRLSSLALLALAWLAPGTPLVTAAETKGRDHWAFQPLSAAPPPVVKDTGWAKSEVDRFVLAKLESAQRHPSPPADRRTLLRRVTYDLTGLPPTREEVEAFLTDTSPEAFGKVVERLLDSSAYGEKWGRYWLDVVRYADTAGENSDRPLPEAWRYRNWVIAAFNHDLPYDEFIRLQLAGDILAPAGPPEQVSEKIIATGFLAIARRFGHDISQDMHLTFEDTIDTMGKTFLGLTLGCARCHDHKYDPISTRDYYGLYGIFRSTRFPFTGCEAKPMPRDLVPLSSKEVQERFHSWESEMKGREEAVKKAEAALKNQPKPADPKATANQTPSGEAEKALQAALAEAKQTRDKAAEQRPPLDLAYAVAEDKPINSRIQKRGEPKEPGEEVPRKFLDVFGGANVPAGTGSGRAQLAGWLTSGPARDLTARVMVNRIWAGHFGEGIVGTPNDFGTRGQPPTDPALLDYLATKFIQSGWSIKATHRLILSSAAYQRSSETTDGAAPFPRRRLTAEEIRDTLLMTSGNLDRSPAGPHPFPTEDKWKYTQHNPFAAVYDSNHRSVYLMVQRTRRHPFLALFDGADPNASTPIRSQSTVPTQALYFLNDPFVHQQAKALAQHLVNSATEDEARLDQAALQLYGRVATPDEKALMTTFLTDTKAAMPNLNEPERSVQAWAAWLRVMFGTNELLYVD